MQMLLPFSAVLVLVAAVPTACAEDLPGWGYPRFQGKRVLITGGDSGIGYAAAEAFYLECAHITLSGHSENKTREAAATVAALVVPSFCKDALPSVAWMVADVRNHSQVKALLEFATSRYGGLDVAVNNAGTGPAGTLDLGMDGFVKPDGHFSDEKVLEVNLEGALRCMHAEISYWLSAGLPGIIVNVASVCGETALCNSLYTGSKWAMEGFSRQAALKYAGKQIRINVLDPGAVNTTLLRGGRSPDDPTWLADRKALENAIPTHHIAEPWEMAGPITFLSSNMSSYITGSTVTADGGLTLLAQARERKGSVDEQRDVQLASVGSALETSETTKDTAPHHWGMPRFRGKRVLVTGGDDGIGLAAVQAFYLECAKVLLVGHNSTKAQKASEATLKLAIPQACEGSSPTVDWAVADVANASQVEEMMEVAVAKLGAIDIAVNNAGIYDHSQQEIGSANFIDADGNLADKAVLDVNLRGTLKCMHAEVRHWLLRNATGSIVNIASVFGEVAWGAPVYTSSKWAMIGFTKRVAMVYAGSGIRVNAVAPGFVNTSMLRGNATGADWARRRQYLEEMVPLHAVAETWEMAGPITFLSSDMATYMTGTVVTADGGLTQAGPFAAPGDARDAWHPLADDDFAITV